jgi:hypothetical protein
LEELLIMPMSIPDAPGSNREAVEAELGGFGYLKQESIQRLQILAILALDDTLKSILEELRVQGMEDAPTVLQRRIPGGIAE